MQYSPDRSQCRVEVENRQDDLPIAPEAFSSLVWAILKGEAAHADEIGVHLVSLEEICQLHEQYFNDSSPTDCISFPIDGPKERPRMLGEVVVCPKVAIGYVEERGGDPYQEVALYVVHGMLHLLGYDDLQPADRERMRQAEARYATEIGKCGQLLRPNRP